jgi:hypothetical protein
MANGNAVKERHMRMLATLELADSGTKLGTHRVLIVGWLARSTKELRYLASIASQHTYSPAAAIFHDLLSVRPRFGNVSVRAAATLRQRADKSFDAASLGRHPLSVTRCQPW